jgi:tetratricopeptide (TPR) repeat protein
MTCRIFGAALLVLLVVPVRAQEGKYTALGELERRLTDNADDVQAANAYRRAVIAEGAYDRALKFFETLVDRHPRAANAFLNYGFAHVDKIPTAGSITQVILANSALTQFTHSIALQPSWIGYYTRGASYLFWPKIFGRAPLGIADLKEALRIQQGEPKRSHHARTFVALGDGYWKMDDPAHARETWREGLKQFPGHKALAARMNGDAAALDRIIDEAFDPSRRVDTDLSELWSEQ